MVMISAVLVTLLMMVVIVVMLRVVGVVVVELVLEVVVGDNYPHSLSLTEEPRWQRGGESF